jgi:hypothetical protein
MNTLGYYAMDSRGNLFRFEWGTGENKGLFYIIDRQGKHIDNPDNFDIIEVGYFHNR